MNLEHLNKLTPVEQAAVKWQYHLYGEFFTTLFKAISLADEDNLQALTKAFPIETEAFSRYKSEPGWWDAIQDRLDGVLLQCNNAHRCGHENQKWINGHCKHSVPHLCDSPCGADSCRCLADTLLATNSDESSNVTCIRIKS